MLERGDRSRESRRWFLPLVGVCEIEVDTDGVGDSERFIDESSFRTRGLGFRV